ncbi:vWA domain-containing protein [Allonocardiopsis opalescens]|uniref:VWFA domain-containing protein n=1 Tax=Allonocardiopsis opalescens TaxID=1144618 RepID=A0A2T0QC04_9ACTN|nr:hypothetical protein [Allonocardiopsis opalescens]PRY01484.1 hypothetical protein CLV72_10166 [Allonocardiopsis opalescens]
MALKKETRRILIGSTATFGLVGVGGIAANLAGLFPALLDWARALYIVAAIVSVLLLAVLVVDSIFAFLNEEYRLRWLVLGVGALAVLGLAVVGVYTRLADPSCPPPAEMNVLVPADQEEIMGEAAEVHADVRAEEDWPTHCRPVHITVFSLAEAAEARGRLATGWRDATVGPRPHVWIPASTADVVLARARAEGDRAVGVGSAPGFEVRGSTRLEPLVLGVPQDAAAEVGVDTEPGPRRHVVQEPLEVYLDRLGPLDIALARPDLDGSVSALLHTAAVYRSAGPGAHPQRGVPDSSLGGAGDRDLLCALRERSAGSEPVAVLTTERALIDHNFGRPLGPGCGPEDPPPPLQAYYPADLPWLDHPYVRLDWGVDDRVAEEADAFYRWLSDPGTRTPDGRHPLAGFRDADGALRCPVPDRGGWICGDEGTVTVAPVWAAERLEPLETGAAYSAEELRAVLERYEEARPEIAVLLAVDTSTSMEVPAGGGTDRLGAATGLAGDLVGLLGEEDSVGLWSFPGSPGDPDATDHDEPVPMAANTEGGQAEPVADALAALGPTGQATPLADVVADGARALADAGGPGAGRVLVVLTDGVADPLPAGGLTADELAEELAGPLEQGVRVHVVTFGDDGCGPGSLPGALTDAGVRCHAAPPGADPRILHEIVADARGRE